MPQWNLESEPERQVRVKWERHAAFRRPLRWGDAEQVQALRAWERELEGLSERAEEMAGLPMRRWRVTYSYTEVESIEVDARDPEEAEELVVAKYADSDAEIESVELVKPVIPAERSKHEGRGERQGLGRGDRPAQGDLVAQADASDSVGDAPGASRREGDPPGD